jgi:hypothetical protein
MLEIQLYFIWLRIGRCGGLLWTRWRIFRFRKMRGISWQTEHTLGTLVNFYQTTRCYNPEDSNLHTHRRENLKSYWAYSLFLKKDSARWSWLVSYICKRKQYSPWTVRALSLCVNMKHVINTCQKQSFLGKMVMSVKTMHNWGVVAYIPLCVIQAKFLNFSESNILLYICKIPTMFLYKPAPFPYPSHTGTFCQLPSVWLFTSAFPNTPRTESWW